MLNPSLFETPEMVSRFCFVLVLTKDLLKGLFWFFSSGHLCQYPSLHVWVPVFCPRFAEFFNNMFLFLIFLLVALSSHHPLKFG